MKNTTKKKKTHTYPSKKTRWAYYMQAIEPTSEALNKAFPEYHPQWVQMSQMRAISPAMFIAFRELLGMNKEQCAAYLRIDVRTLHRWESGRCPISFAAFELLRVIQESVTFKMSHPVWDGWFISMDGVLVSPDLGGNQGLFTPGRLNYIASQGTEASHLRREVNRLEAELNETKEENTQLRQMFVAQGVVDELAAMQNTISELMNRIATARIIQFPAAPIDQPQEIAA